MQDLKFQEYLQSLAIKDSSINKYLGVFRNIPKNILNDAEKINRFIANRNRKYNDSILYYSVIKHYLRFKRNIDVLPLIKYPRIQRKIRTPHYYDISIIFKIIERIPIYNYKIAAYVQFFGGMRAYEVMQVRKDDINILDDETMILVKSAKRKPYTVSIVGIGFEKLKEYIENKPFRPNDLIFCKDTRSRDDITKIRTNIRYYQQIVKDTAMNLGYNLTTHDLKRNLARFLRKDRNLTIEEIKEALHHSSVNTTMGYIGEIRTDRVYNRLKSIDFN